MPLQLQCNQMRKDYKISNDGTIFEIRADGSISKIARIDERGNISSINGDIRRQQGGKGKYWFFIILFIVTTAVLGILYIQTSDSLSYYRWEYYDTKEELSEAKSVISDVADVYPMIITDIEIGNSYKEGELETDYGDRIYDYNTMYLKPRIKYIGLESGTKELKVKWYKPDGTIRRGSKSPDGFSQASDEYISTGENTLTLRGWGNENKGHWDYGTHRIEIWYKNTCLKSKTFKIY